MLATAARTYKHRVLPTVQGLRGATRLLRLLETAAFTPKLSVQQNPAGYTWNGLYMLDRLDFAPLLYEHQVVQQFIDKAENTPIVADIGAYHGFYSLVAARSATQVYTFEMNERNYTTLEKIVKMNTARNIELQNLAVLDRNGTVTYDPDGAKSSVEQGTQNVDCKTLDAFFEPRPDPDLLKIDVEGAENKVLRGAETLIERNAPTIFLENHGPDLASTEQALQDLDYTYTTLQTRSTETILLAEKR